MFKWGVVFTYNSSIMIFFFASLKAKIFFLVIQFWFVFSEAWFWLWLAQPLNWGGLVIVLPDYTQELFLEMAIRYIRTKGNLYGRPSENSWTLVLTFHLRHGASQCNLGVIRLVLKSESVSSFPLLLPDPGLPAAAPGRGSAGSPSTRSRDHRGAVQLLVTSRSCHTQRKVSPNFQPLPFQGSPQPAAFMGCLLPLLGSEVFTPQQL